MKDFDWDEMVLSTVLLVMVACLAALIFYAISSSDFENEENKQECYEVYATDNVILKKCEQYFDTKGSETENDKTK